MTASLHKIKIMVGHLDGKVELYSCTERMKRLTVSLTTSNKGVRQISTLGKSKGMILIKKYKYSYVVYSINTVTCSC